MYKKKRKQKHKKNLQTHGMASSKMTMMVTSLTFLSMVLTAMTFETSSEVDRAVDCIKCPGFTGGESRRKRLGFFFSFFFYFFCYIFGRWIRSHTSCIRTFVIFIHTFVILSCAKKFKGFIIYNYKVASFITF